MSFAASPIHPQERRSRKNRTLLSIALWVIAVILTLASAAYQRMTGPTHPYRGTVVVSGQAVRYKLPRTHAGATNARVSVPEPGPNSGGILRFRRFRTDDEFRAVPLRHEHGQLYAMLPSQPPAGLRPPTSPAIASRKEPTGTFTYTCEGMTAESGKGPR